MRKIKDIIWNPMGFFISFFMSLLMPVIFAIPHGMTLETCVEYWPVRWVVAYFIVTLLVQPVSFKLAGKIFGFKPGK